MANANSFRFVSVVKMWVCDWVLRGGWEGNPLEGGSLGVEEGWVEIKEYFMVALVGVLFSYILAHFGVALDGDFYSKSIVCEYGILRAE